MTDILSLDEGYSTTRLLTQEKPQIINTPEDKFETVLFLPEGENRKGEGGLRTKGYFKKSFDDKPLISIITVVFNGEKYLEETIKSVINQTYENVEYIIIDGGSSDGTLDIIKKYEERIDYWVSEKDKGIYDAMNKGIDVASGEWLNFMNAGDKLNGKEILKYVFINSNIKNSDFIYSDTIFSNNTIFKCDIKINRIVHQSLIYKRDIHYENGLYIVSKDVTISDYIFFMISKNKNWTKIDNPISVFDLEGVSSNIKHYKQKIAVDLIWNNTNRIKASFMLIIHPIYNKIKRFFK